MPVETITPLPPIERMSAPEDLVHVAGHELNHALVAHAMGVPVTHISVHPQGDSLGRTVLGGNVGFDALKIIAAAGSVDTPEGEAMGYGSDLFKANLITAFYGGMTVEEARTSAASVLSHYSPDVRKKAAMIIATMGSITNPDLGKIMEWARLEVKYDEEGIIDPRLLRESPTFQISRQTPENRYTIIDNFGEERYRIRWIQDKKYKEKFMCAACLEVRGHAKDCPKVQTDESRGEQDNTFVSSRFSEHSTPVEDKSLEEIL